MWKRAMIGALALVGCGTTIRPGQAGVKYLALGDGLQREVKAEGFYFHWPWNDIEIYDVTWQSKSESVEVLTAEALHLSTKVSVTYRPRKSEIYRLARDIGQNYYRDVIQPAFITIARAEFSKLTHNDLARKSPLVEAAVLARLRAAVAGKPIDIDRVSISHIEFDPNLTASISQKLAIEQKLLQKKAEVEIAERDADILRMTARGQADATRIQAEGNAQAIVLQGEAQARAQEEIGKTLSPAYLRYKAFDGEATRFYFVPVGKDGLPIIVDTDATGPVPMKKRAYPALPSLGASR